jgi:biotin/methionine sulfoxide reductase
MVSKRQGFPTSTHWGNYLVGVEGDVIKAIYPAKDDPEPTEMGQSLLNAQDPDCRIPQPMVRKGYLQNREKSDGCKRGFEAFVALGWDEALDLAAEAIENTRKRHGNEAIYGGSYGWASAGRFHHAQSQLHRFLNSIGGYVFHRDSYSTAAADVIMPRVIGIDPYTLIFQAPQVADIAQHTDVVVCFGGIAMKNTEVMFSGVGAHSATQQLKGLKEKGINFVNISPVKDDMADYLDADWLACRPNSDVAIMLGMAHTLVTENLHDEDFINRYCVGFEKFQPYLSGEDDGIIKNAQWAAKQSGIPAKKIQSVARALAKKKSIIGISWSLQRSEHGEQSYWMATVLAALVGQIGLPGRGIAYGYGSVHNIGFAGRHLPNYKMGSFPQGENPVQKFIPVARIADMLLKPGERFQYNGRALTYPEIKLVYWAGGNPFHHHQDLNRLRKAWTKPETIIVNEPFWTATARHADIVFPCTTMLERNDIGGSSFDCYLTPMQRSVSNFAESRSDYEIFTGLALRLGTDEVFTEGRDEEQWLKEIYKTTKESAATKNVSLPEFEEFWKGDAFSVEEQIPAQKFVIEQYREDPDAHPLKTPSGNIEIYSETIAGFHYDDCIGHPKWYEKKEWLGATRAENYPLHLISNQPKRKLHSQFDHSEYCRSGKTRGRATARMHPEDAKSRGINEGDVIKLFNNRGACLAGVSLTTRIRTAVIELETGAWYDPLDPSDVESLEVHGNPNVLTRDAGTSQLAQGPTAHSCLVEVEKYKDELPPVKIFSPPEIETTE